MGMKDFFGNLFNTNNNQNASNNISTSEADMSTETSSHDAFVASLAPENYSGGTFPDTTPASNHGTSDNGGREVGGDGRSDRDSGRDRGGDENTPPPATETSPESDEEDSTEENDAAAEDEDSVSIEIEGGDKEGMANQSPCTGKGIDDIIADNDEDDGQNDGPDDDGPNGSGGVDDGGGGGGGGGGGVDDGDDDGIE